MTERVGLCWLPVAPAGARRHPAAMAAAAQPRASLHTLVALGAGAFAGFARWSSPVDRLGGRWSLVGRPVWRSWWRRGRDSGAWGLCRRRCGLLAWRRTGLRAATAAVDVAVCGSGGVAVGGSGAGSLGAGVRGRTCGCAVYRLGAAVASACGGRFRPVRTLGLARLLRQRGDASGSTWRRRAFRVGARRHSLASGTCDSGWGVVGGRSVRRPATVAGACPLPSARRRRRRRAASPAPAGASVCCANIVSGAARQDGMLANSSCAARSSAAAPSPKTRIDIDSTIAANRKRKPGSMERQVPPSRDSAKALEPSGTR